jgi:choline-glycine betaine transporter
MGGLQGLQTASIIAATPFLLVMVGLCVSLWHSLLDELEEKPRRPLMVSPVTSARNTEVATPSSKSAL